MNTDVSHPNGCKSKPSATIERQKCEVAPEEDESNPLLSPRRGGMSKKPKKSRQKVQWNDRNGDKLAEVLEFQPRTILYGKLQLLLFPPMQFSPHYIAMQVTLMMRIQTLVCVP